jgi:tetratricopeptide (TPR) repeat protein
VSQLRVFVSHASQDKPFTDTLVHSLRRAGADVWYDEHNLGAGHLVNDIQRELATRPAFVVVLSKAAFASEWVSLETGWAWNLYRREPQRILLPVVAHTIEPSDFNAMLFLEDFKRVDGPGNQAYPQAEAIERTLRLLGLTPPGQAVTPAAPQPSESADDLIARGKALAAQKQYAEAVPLFERATQLAPGDFDAWFQLGYSQAELGRWQEALVAYDRALTITPSSAASWTNKGNALYSLKRYAEALAAYERALAIDDTLAIRWTGKGSALNGLKRYDEALMAYEHALTLDPSFVLAWISKGRVLENVGRYAEALPAYERATSLAADSAEYWNDRADALRKLGRHEEALTAYSRALELSPSLIIAWNNKAISLRALGRAAEAQEAERRALRVLSR